MNKNKLFNRIYENTYNSEKLCSEVPVVITNEGDTYIWLNSDVFAELGVKSLNYNWGYKNGNTSTNEPWLIEEDKIEDAIDSAKKEGLSFAEDRDFAGTFKYFDNIYDLTDISTICEEMSIDLHKKGDGLQNLAPKPVEKKAMFKDGYIIVPLDKPLTSVEDVDMAEYINDFGYSDEFLERLDCNYGDKEVIYKLNPEVVDITWEEWKNMFDR